MIANITGVVIEKGLAEVTLETGFFSLRIFCSRPTAEQAKIQQELRLHTHLHVREDDLSLFGFLSKNELGLFRHLISVSGIGPKIALEILSAGEKSVEKAISSGDAAFLQSIKGIGKKTAQRAILELQEKIESDTSGMVTERPNISHEEAMEALIGLGFKKTEITKQFQKVPKELKKAEEIIKWFLTKH
jgi:Holliday junction DNA helicase RuvA